MPDVLIRNIDEKTLKRLKEKAIANKRSLQAELKQAIEEYAGPAHSEVIDMVREIQEKFISEGKKFPDSTDEIRKDRER